MKIATCGMILCLTLALLLGIGTASAQTDKGNIVFMGTAAFGTTSSDGNSQTDVELSPRGYYFMMDQLAIGGRLSFRSTSYSGSSTSSVLFGPDALYFFRMDSKELLPFAGLGLFLSSYSNGESTTGFTFSLHGGLSYLLKEHLSIFPEAALDIESRDGNTSTTFGVGVGLAGFLY